MNENLTTIIISLITVLFGGGAWKFYEFIINKKSDDKKIELSEKTMYRDDLKSRVFKLEEDKEECARQLGQEKQGPRAKRRILVYVAPHKAWHRP